ncbi:VanZ family protein [Siminovitchia acidinfaciens]|uniref:VanZ family protein n=1 Tax=Siminovitchia acidinfaciens TaxID=2321395 RepID=A0A429XW24_9BACI|nr:VanZ family protein [Siminovitchia acidinfaciens]RST72572.1 VanZ family protein [Siminovitchia acidinfaciens]
MFIGKYVLRILPYLYILFIWVQSSWFNPESVYRLSNYLSFRLIVLIGFCLELAHLIEFGILYLLIIIAFLTYGNLTKKKEILAMGAAILYGIVDEIHQLFTPYRSFSTVDIIKDVIGVVVMWWIVRRAYYKEKPPTIGGLLKKVTQTSARVKR